MVFVFLLFFFWGGGESYLCCLQFLFYMLAVTLLWFLWLKHVVANFGQTACLVISVILGKFSHSCYSPCMDRMTYSWQLYIRDVLWYFINELRCAVCLHPPPFFVVVEPIDRGELFAFGSHSLPLPTIVY